MEICEYTKEGGNICPPSKIIYMKYLLILLGRMFLTLKHVIIKFINTVLKLYFKTNIQDTNIIENMF